MDYTKPEVVDSLVKSLQQKYKDDTQVVIHRASPTDQHAEIGKDVAYFYQFRVEGSVPDWFDSIIDRDKKIAPEKVYHLVIKQFTARLTLNGEQITATVAKFLEEKKVESGKKRTAKPKKDSDREADQRDT